MTYKWKVLSRFCIQVMHVCNVSTPLSTLQCTYWTMWPFKRIFLSTCQTVGANHSCRWWTHVVIFIISWAHHCSRGLIVNPYKTEAYQCQWWSINFKSHPLELAIYQEVSLYTMKSVIPVTQGKELSKLHILVSQVYSKREWDRQSFMAPLVPLGTGTSISKISPHHPLFASVTVIFT